jgi:predicted dehydrogenase
MTSLRAGIVGAGFIGDIHARAIRAAGGILSCIAEVDEHAAQRAEARLAPLRSTASLEALLESDDVDVVHICTPNALHAAAAEMVLEAGKHVVCEKPLATTVEDAQRLGALADKLGIVATVPFIYRYYPLTPIIHAGH